MSDQSPSRVHADRLAAAAEKLTNVEIAQIEPPDVRMRVFEIKSAAEITAAQIRHEASKTT